MRRIEISGAHEDPVGDGLVGDVAEIKPFRDASEARAWLDSHGIAHGFHDYKLQGVERSVLEGWARAVGWETLLNRSGTTFRKLPDADKAALDEVKAIRLMLAQPSMIKRPVLDVGGALVVGFRPENYATTFSPSPARP